MDDEAAGVTDIGDVGEEFDGVDEFFSGFEAALDTEADEAAEVVAEVAFGGGVAGVVFQAGVIDPGDLGVLFEPAGYFEGIAGVLLLAEWEGFESLEELERVEGAEGHAGVAQPLDAEFDDEGDISEAGEVAEDVPEFQAMVAGIGFGEFGELAIAVVEFTAVDHDATDGGAVTADVFGGGGGEDIGAVFEGADEADADRVIDHEGDAGVVGDFGEGFEVGDIEFRVADGFAVDGAGFGGDGLAEGVEVAGVDEIHRAAEFGHGVVEELVGAAVEVIGGDDFITDLGDIEDSERGCGLAGGDSEGTGASFERGDALFEDIGGGVHDAGVDIPELLEGEKIGGVVAIFENVGRGLVDGDGAGACGGVGGLSGVEGERAEFHGFVFLK
ncbi:MAG: hypothetical protein RI897_2824 [Verrucomicrobiota bacterium]